MILKQIRKQKDGSPIVRVFEIRTQVNLSFRLCYSPGIPFTFELGLGLITISYEVWKS